MPHYIEIAATALFAIAIIHTFSVPVFARLAHKNGPNAGLWHFMAEVEAVFGIWAFILLVLMAIAANVHEMIEYVDTRDFTEPLFVFAIMVVAASRPIIELVSMLVRMIARVLPFNRQVSTYFVVMTFVPLAGSLITEPAAMTLAALLLRDGYFKRSGFKVFKYTTLGVLFVNVSIGGVLSAYAAPPVLMVAKAFGWDSAFMLSNFGIRAIAAVVINALVLTMMHHKLLAEKQVETKQGVTKNSTTRIPAWVIAIHLFFLIGVVVFAHHTAIFIGLLLFFIGFCEAYKRYQSPLMIKEGLLVGFFLAGLVVLGGLQKWWLQDLLGSLSPIVLFWGATALTALTDNAALTYLGSMVDGTSDTWRYMLVAGAVTGGGLTVIANAPNPAGYSILKTEFPDETISPVSLFLSAWPPTLVAAALFLI